MSKMIEHDDGTVEVFHTERDFISDDAVLGEVPSGSLCEICNKIIDDLNGNPDFWGVAIPYQDGNGKMKYYHRGCVSNIIARHFA